MKRNWLIILTSICILLAVAAGCIEGSFTKTETALVKLDQQENIQWISVIENPDYATAMALARPQFCQFIQTSDNGFFVAGYYSNRSGYTTLRVFRTDSNGTPIWDEKLAGVESMGGPMISPIQWEDGGYSVILSGGRVNNFDAAGRSLGAANIQDPICRTNGTVCYDLTPVSLTQNPDGSLTWILTNGNFSTSETSLISAMLTRNGTLLTKEILPLKISTGVTDFIRTNDKGWLSGKGYRDDASGGGNEILIEKTNASSDVSWDTVLGACNKTAFCNNDLIGMHESGDGYDIIYQSYPQQSNESVPADTISVRLDSQGHIVRQDKISDLSGRHVWIFANGGSRADFSEQSQKIPQKVLDSSCECKRHK